VAALDAAARAPSAHNTQPWVVSVEARGDAAHLTIRADGARWLRHGDPSRRDLHLSLGAFVEALRVTLAASGVRAEPEAPTAARDDVWCAAFRVSAAPGTATPEERAAASLLRRRQTSRLRYAPRAPDAASLDALGAAARRAGLDLHLVPREAGERRDLDGWCYAAARETWLDVRAVAELGAWLRIDPEGSLRPEDGLSTHCLGLSLAETAAMTVLARPGFWRAARAAYLAPLVAAPLARAEAAAFEQAPFIGVLVAPGAAGEAGAGFLRVWLEATRVGLALAPASALLDRRGWELGRRLGVSPQRLVAAFRLGRSVPPPWSGRRPASRFASVTMQEPGGVGIGVA